MTRVAEGVEVAGLILVAVGGILGVEFMARRTSPRVHQTLRAARDPDLKSGMRLHLLAGRGAMTRTRVLVVLAVRVSLLLWWIRYFVPTARCLAICLLDALLFAVRGAESWVILLSYARLFCLGNVFL